MKHTLRLIQLIPYLVWRRLRGVIRSLGFRKPSTRFYIVALSGGAVMIWTRGGNIVVPAGAARSIANRLEIFADLSERRDGKSGT
jgi:hypothetical protein